MVQFRPALPLNADMLNPEAVMKLPAGLFDKGIIISGIRLINLLVCHRSLDFYNRKPSEFDSGVRGRTSDQIIAHHSHIFMFQVVAVIQEKSRIVSEPHNYPDSLTGH